ncbi:MAG: YceI family protein [Actinomycetota bacterium]
MAKFTWTSESVVELNADSSVHPIHGEIRNLRGEANVDVVDGKLAPGPGASAWIEADVDQLGTGKKLEDMALRKQIDAKKYPNVRYELRSVEGGPDSFKVAGAFTFHGVSQDFVEEVQASLNGGRLQVEAEHTFDIRDFGVQPFKVPVINLQIKPEVKLVVRLVGTESAGGGGWG